MSLYDPVYSVTIPLDSSDGISAKSVPIGAGMAGAYSYGSPWVDAYSKQRAPSPLELVRYCLDTIYACTSLNAEGVANTPGKLYVKTTARRQKSRLIERGDTRTLSRTRLKAMRGNPRLVKTMADADEVQEVVSHPLLDLLAKPTDPQTDDGVGMSEYVLWETTQRYLEVVGRAYWYVERDGVGGTPSAIWILPAHLIQEIPDTSGDRVIAYYVYTAGNRKTRYEVDEIVPFRLPDLHTGGYIGGFSPTRAAFEQATIFRQYKALTIAQLQNGGKPSAIWSPAGEGAMIGSAQAVRMRGAFREAFAMSAAGGIMVMNQPGKLDMLSWPANEVVSPEQYTLCKVAIANCFAVPSSKLDRNDANRASAMTGDYAHARDAIVPRLRRNEATINCFMVPMYDDSGQLFFAYDEPEGLKDQETEQKRYESAVTSGAIVRNEQREELGYDPVPWGDQPLVASTQVAVEPDGKPKEPPEPKPMPGAQQKPVKPSGNGKALKALRATAKSLAEVAEMLTKTAERRQSVIVTPAPVPALPPAEDDDILSLLKAYEPGRTPEEDKRSWQWEGSHDDQVQHAEVHVENADIAVDAGGGGIGSGASPARGEESPAGTKETDRGGREGDAQ